MGAAAFLAFPRTAPGVDRTDIRFHVLPWSNDNPGKGFHKFPGFTTSICPTRPESRGEFRQKSPDPMDPTAIQGNCLSTERDRRTIVAGLLSAREICWRAGFRSGRGGVLARAWSHRGRQCGVTERYQGTRHHNIPPMRHGYDWGRQAPGRALPGAGNRGIEGGGCFGYAFDSPGQHQRGSEHDCREDE